MLHHKHRSFNLSEPHFLPYKKAFPGPTSQCDQRKQWENRGITELEVIWKTLRNRVMKRRVHVRTLKPEDPIRIRGISNYLI